MGECEKQPQYAFFSHRQCEFFPCHPTQRPEEFNCMFCYCPLYTLGPDCGGHFRYLESGVKSCEDCMLPHSPGGYAHILSKFPELARLAGKSEGGQRRAKAGGTENE